MKAMEVLGGKKKLSYKIDNDNKKVRLGKSFANQRILRGYFSMMVCAIALTSCNDGAAKPANSENDSSARITSVADLVPADRTTVKKEPVASYSEKIKNPLNDWRFQVQLYETPKTFRFLMKLEYEEMRESDTLKIPNLGFEPKLKIIKGEEPNSCIIGFLDKQEKFREYKKVIATNNRLRVITLKHYAVYLK